MKIDIVTTYPFPSSQAPGNRILFFTTALSKLPNVQVRVISDVKDSSYISSASYEMPGKPSLINVQSISFERNRLILRAVYELVHAFKIYKKIDHSADLVIFTIPSIQLMFVSLLLRKNTFALDIRDVVWEYLSERKLLDWFARVTIRMLFRLSAKRASFVSTTNDHQASLIKKLTTNNCVLIPNGISRSKYEALKKCSHDYTKTETVSISYIGNLGIAQNLSTLIDVASEFPEICFNIVGDGTMRSKLSKDAIELGLENVKFWGLKPWHEVVNFMTQSNILFAQIDDQFSSAVPTKIFEYVAIGKKVILGLPDGVARGIFQEFSGVFIYKSGSIDGMISSIKEAIVVNNIDVARNHALLEKKYIRENFEETFTQALLYPPKG